MVESLRAQAERRENLIRELRLRLLAPATNKSAQELEAALRDAIDTVERHRRSSKPSKAS